MHARRLTLDARRSTPRSQSGVKGEGTHFRIPWLQTPHIFDVRIRPRNISSATGTKDLQVVTINLRVLSQPDKDMLPQIFQQYGKLTASWLGSGLGQRVRTCCPGSSSSTVCTPHRGTPHRGAVHLSCTVHLCTVAALTACALRLRTPCAVAPSPTPSPRVPCTAAPPPPPRRSRLRRARAAVDRQ